MNRLNFLRSERFLNIALPILTFMIPIAIFAGLIVLVAFAMGF